MMKFICESAEYPVFRDYPTKIATNQTKKYQVVCNKDFDEGIVKIELIDTANDPLIDSTAEPVKQVTMPDEKDKNHKLTIVHKAASSKDYILRISAQAPSGNVLVDTRYLERMV